MMATDLLLQLLEIWSFKRKVPDILYREWIENEEGEEEYIIRFEFFSGKIIDFGYTPERYALAWKAFNNYWNTLNVEDTNF